MTVASGIGSWPGTDGRRAVGMVRHLLGEGSSDAASPDVPYLPELPARGPGSDLIGRSAGLLADLPVDLQPSGWRLVDHPGRDARRTQTWLRHDLDELAEAYDGYVGPLKVQVAGPWTLAAELRVARGERVVVDAGACRDVAASLAEGVRSHIAEVRRLVPGATLVVQLDEPSLPSVLAGRLPTSSGYGTHRAVDPLVVRAGLATVTDGVRDAGVDEVVVHCCAARVPIGLLREAGADGLAVDIALLGHEEWEAIAEAIEAGTRLWAGIDANAAVPDAPTLTRARRLIEAWTAVGLPRADIGEVVLTPPCGLAAATPDGARATQARVRDVARALSEYAAG